MARSLHSYLARVSACAYGYSEGKAPGSCSLHASFGGRRGGCRTKSSVRSAMFIATRFARSAKLRRSGMYSCSLGFSRGSAEPKPHSWRSYRAWSGALVVTIHMALLTELAWPARAKMRVRCSQRTGALQDLAEHRSASMVAPASWTAVPMHGDGSRGGESKPTLTPGLQQANHIPVPRCNDVTL